MTDTEWKKRIVIVLVSLFGLAAPAALTGCNTTEGFGEDIEATGDAIEEGAN